MIVIDPSDRGSASSVLTNFFMVSLGESNPMKNLFLLYLQQRSAIG